MEKHYFFQSFTTSTIYHLDLSQFDAEKDYLSSLARALRITDIDLSCRLTYKDVSHNVLAYNILVYSFARMSGFNQRSTLFKSYKEFLEHYISDMSIIHKAIEYFKPFYKIFKSDNFYGITSY